MPDTLICEEIPHGRHQHILHEITVPDYDEPKWYVTIGALNAFHSGARKGASAVDKEFHHSRCCWGPKALYRLHKRSEWLEEQDRIRKSSEKFGGGNMLNLFKGGDDPKVTSLEDVPRTYHESLPAFFASIGFDQKTRRYRDADGKPIRYSVLDPAKVRRAAETQTTPEIV